VKRASDERERRTLVGSLFELLVLGGLIDELQNLIPGESNMRRRGYIQRKHAWLFNSALALGQALPRDDGSDIMMRASRERKGFFSKKDDLTKCMILGR